MQAPNPIAFTIAGIDVRWYGILIGIAFLLAIYISYRRAPRFDIIQDDILDLTIFLIPFSIIGARAYYVIFSYDNYRGDFIQMLNLRAGGLAIHGGIIAGVIVSYIVARHKKIKFPKLADLIMPQVALAQAIGRWRSYRPSLGNYSLWRKGTSDLPLRIYMVPFDIYLPCIHFKEEKV